jgi:TolA-binding protein
MSILASRRPWVWIYGLTVVVMFLAIGVFVWLALESRREAGTPQAAQTGPIPVERFQLLAQFEAPPYSPGGTSHSRQFTWAMERYLKGDFAGAIPGLRTSDGPEAEFYLAICSVLTGNLAAGGKYLQLVIDAGTNPYVEPARYYLAKALLGKGDIQAARTQLENVIAMHGGLEQRSKALLTQIK